MQLSREDIKQQNRYNYENLVFEGGGIKGFAYLGALKILEEKGILPNIKRVAGTSAGTIIGLLIGLGYDLHSATYELESVFKSYRPRDTLLKIPQVLANFVKNYGIESADFFLKWSEKVVEQKLGNKNATFMDLHKSILQQSMDKQTLKYMYFTGTNLNTGYYEIFSHIHTPTMRIADAVRISMSIPFLFTAQFYKKEGSLKAHLYVDGGVLNNYPLHIFDRNHQPNMTTIGFRVDDKDEISVLQNGAEPTFHPIGGFASYTQTVLSTIQNANNNVMRRSDDKQRTVFINISGVSTLSFDLTSEQKSKIIGSGEDATRKFLNSRPEKLKTNKSRLEKYDRRRIYDKSTKIHYCYLDNDIAKIQYWIKVDTLKEVTKYFDRLKEQILSHRLELYSLVGEDDFRIIEIIGSNIIAKEIEKWDRTISKANIGIRNLNELNAIKVANWKQSDYVELSKVKEVVSAQLNEAASLNNISRVVDLLSSGITIDFQDKQGRTALHCAAEPGYTRIVELLLNNDPKANSNIQDNIGETPLHLASSEGHIHVVRALLINNAKTNIINAYGATPLHRASNKGYIKIAEMLLDFGSNIDASDYLGQTPLHQAVFYGHIDAVALLVEKGADINVEDKKGQTPLQLGVSNNKHEIVQLLLVKGASHKEAQLLKEEEAGVESNSILHEKGKFELREIIRKDNEKDTSYQI